MAENLTPIENKLSILTELWMNYRNDNDFIDFVEYNDLALPLAYAISNEIVDNTPKAQMFIDETWALLLSALDIEDTYGFETLDDLLELSGNSE